MRIHSMLEGICLEMRASLRLRLSLRLTLRLRLRMRGLWAGLCNLGLGLGLGLRGFRPVIFPFTLLTEINNGLNVELSEVSLQYMMLNNSMLTNLLVKK